MIWENLDNQLRKMLGASRDNGEKEHANLFFTISILANIISEWETIIAFTIVIANRK